MSDQNKDISEMTFEERTERVQKVILALFVKYQVKAAVMPALVQQENGSFVMILQEHWIDTRKDNDE